MPHIDVESMDRRLEAEGLAGLLKPGTIQQIGEAMSRHFELRPSTINGKPTRRVVIIDPRRPRRNAGVGSGVSNNVLKTRVGAIESKVDDLVKLLDEEWGTDFATRLASMDVESLPEEE